MNEPAFIQKLKSELAALQRGKALLACLEKSGVSVEEMPPEFQKQYPDNPAMLYIGDDRQAVIYVTQALQAEELAHELAHITHYISSSEHLRQPADPKHLYIFYAAAEADAYAQQVAVLIERMAHGQIDIEAERREAHIIKQEIGDLWDPARFMLYKILDLEPATLTSDAISGNLDVAEIMFQTYAWIFQQFVPYKYEDYHLDGVYGNIQRNNGSQLKHREISFGQHSKADTEFFTDCVCAFGDMIGTDGAHYLIDADNNGPDPYRFLGALLTPDALTALEEMNATLAPPELQDTPAPPEMI